MLVLIYQLDGEGLVSHPVSGAQHRAYFALLNDATRVSERDQVLITW